MPRTGNEAIAWAKGQIENSTENWYRACLMFVRMCFGLDSLYPNAGTAYDKAVKKHPVTSGAQVPRGVPVFWETSGTADHIALSLGGGRCISTDAVRKGKPDIVMIDALTQSWHMTLKGWTEDMNGVTVWSEPKTRGPHIDRALEELQQAKGAGDRRDLIRHAIRDLHQIEFLGGKP